MRECIQFAVDDVVPTSSDVLKMGGMADRSNLSEQISSSLDSALALFAELAEPKGLTEDLSNLDFKAVYYGEGLNAQETPLEGVFSQADRFALFAATVGEPVSDKIRDLFAQSQSLLGFMLDAVASVSTHQLTLHMGRRYLRSMPAEQHGSGDVKSLPYTPGYCGWHISGQAKLFQYLRPEEIGITLRPSYIMQPLKSVAGALITGKSEIHRYKGNYPFCKDCRTKQCIARMTGDE